jgi:hypothetical protein
MNKTYPPIKPGRKWLKRILAKIIFIFLGRAFQAATRFDPDIRREVEDLPEHFTMMMNIQPNGPSMSLEKAGPRLMYRGGSAKTADLTINFKNLECALMVLLPIMGADRAFAERRMNVRGDLAMASAVTRCLNILLAHLYPRIVCRNLMKRLPAMPLSKQLVRLKILFAGIPLGL